MQVINVTRKPSFIFSNIYKSKFVFIRHTRFCNDVDWDHGVNNIWSGLLAASGNSGEQTLSGIPATVSYVPPNQPCKNPHPVQAEI